MYCLLLVQHTGTVDFPGSCKSGSVTVFSGATVESAHPAQQRPIVLLVQFRHFKHFLRLQVAFRLMAH